MRKFFWITAPKTGSLGDPTTKGTKGRIFLVNSSVLSALFGSEAKWWGKNSNFGSFPLIYVKLDAILKRFESSITIWSLKSVKMGAPFEPFGFATRENRLPKPTGRFLNGNCFEFVFLCHFWEVFESIFPVNGFKWLWQRKKVNFVSFLAVPGKFVEIFAPNFRVKNAKCLRTLV